MDVFSSIFTIIAALVLPLPPPYGLCTRKRGYLNRFCSGGDFFFISGYHRIPLLQYVTLPSALVYYVRHTSTGFSGCLYGDNAALFEEGGAGSLCVFLCVREA